MWLAVEHEQDDIAQLLRDTWDNVMPNTCGSSTHAQCHTGRDYNNIAGILRSAKMNSDVHLVLILSEEQKESILNSTSKDLQCKKSFKET